ncbi:MAG TPA: maleylpyruvate isomerase family mycothiol-dependent enzyme [Nakamurella sp.]
MSAGFDRVPDSVAADLLLAARGTDYFSRRLDGLTDAEYEAPSLLPGWDRRHVIAHVGYNARALTRLVRWAHSGAEIPMYASTQARDAEIDAGATMPPDALRSLHHRELDNLTTAWRDLPADRWDFPVRTAQGRTVPVSVTPWMRVREVWLHAVDLDNGGRFEDFPPELVDRLLVDITSWWARSGDGTDLVLRPTDRAGPWPIVTGSSMMGGPGAVTITGTAAQLARWASGRGTGGVVTGTGRPVSPPRWL